MWWVEQGVDKPSPHWQVTAITVNTDESNKPLLQVQTHSIPSSQLSLSRLGRQNVSATPRTKFRANWSIFCEVITFRIFSRWPPSAMLNFEKFKFWINFRGRSQNLCRHTKFGQNRMIAGRDIAIQPKSNMAAVAMLNLLPVYILIHFQDYEDKMRPHTKFCANRCVFREVMMFRIFSRSLPSAILNFEKFKFWINLQGWSRNLRQHTKFGQNRMFRYKSFFPFYFYFYLVCSFLSLFDFIMFGVPELWWWGALANLRIWLIDLITG